MRLRDEDMLEMYADKVRKGDIKQANHLTNLLYIFAKYRWKSSRSDDYLQVALQKIMSEPGLNSYLATRNLWNIYAFDYHDE
mmetsp:Transcript_23803/g.29639  ORF Transcript_23803/g.29639 Transcript_23803/m.29639 type:complete len:82 (-) Transcript_23803:1141-1386(-)